MDHISNPFGAIKKNKLNAKIWKRVKEIQHFSSAMLQPLYKLAKYTTRLNVCVLGLNFLSDYAKSEEES